MDLLKIIASPLRRLFSPPTKPEPAHELTPFGRQLFWEAYRKRNLLQEQKQSKQ